MLCGSWWYVACIGKNASHDELLRKCACRIYLKGTGRAVVTALSLIVTKNERDGAPAGCMTMSMIFTSLTDKPLVIEKKAAFM